MYKLIVRDRASNELIMTNQSENLKELKRWMLDDQIRLGEENYTYEIVEAEKEITERTNEIVATIERAIKQTEKQLQEEKDTLIRRLTDLDYHTTIYHGHSNTTEKIGKLALKLQMLHEQKDQLQYILKG